MTSSHPTPALCQWSSYLAAVLDRRSAPWLALLFLGAVLARGRRTVTSWIRAAKLGGEFQSCYTAVAAAARADSSRDRRDVSAVVGPRERPSLRPGLPRRVRRACSLGR